MSINRTTLELKFVFYFYPTPPGVAINRTTLELKSEFWDQGAKRVIDHQPHHTGIEILEEKSDEIRSFSINRTTLELK